MIRTPYSGAARALRRLARFLARAVATRRARPGGIQPLDTRDAARLAAYREAHFAHPSPTETGNGRHN